MRMNVRTYRKGIALLAVLLLLLMMGACGQSGSEEESDPIQETTETATDVTSDSSATDASGTETTQGGSGTSGTAVLDEYLGNWQDPAGAAALSIYKMKGACYADVTWKDEDRDEAWTMECTYDESTGTLRYENGTKVRNVTDDSGSEEAEEVYSNGAGSFSLSGGTITWQDEIEGAGAGCSFVSAE